MNTKKEIDLCSQFIEKFTKRTERINRKHSSYSFKHDVERWAGCYISNESFIQAAKIAGLKSELTSSLNEYYNLKLIKTKLNTPYAREGKNQ